MLSSQAIREIKQLIREGYSASYIARFTNRSLTTIYRIRNSKTIENPQMQLIKSITIPKRLYGFTQFVKKRINHGVTNIKKISRELQQEGYKGSYMEVYRYIKSIPNKNKSRDRVFVKRYETLPGEQAQVDWGSFGKIIINGKKERLYAFAYTLAYSRMKYIEFTIRQNLQTLQNCHIHAFNHLGISKKILYDNMKTVVLERDRKNNLKPIYNAGFQDFAKYYGVQIDLSYPYWPRDKGKVESVIKNVRNDFMNGMRFGRDFHSLDGINEKVAHWVNTEVNRRIHRSTEEIPLVRFEEERKYLRFPNASKKYETSFSSARYVTKYGMVQYKCNSYSVPQQFARKKVVVNERSEQGLGIIDIYYKNKIIATHELSFGRNKWIQKEEHFKINAKNSLKAKSRNKKQKGKDKILQAVTTKPLSYYDNFLKV